MSALLESLLTSDQKADCASNEPQRYIGNYPIHTTTVFPWGFPMEVTFEWDEGESPIFWPTERSHPGSPPNAELLECYVGGVSIMRMLTADLLIKIEAACIDYMEE